MNIKDLTPGSYTVVEQPKMNIRDLKPDEYTVVQPGAPTVAPETLGSGDFLKWKSNLLAEGMKGAIGQSAVSPIKATVNLATMPLRVAKDVAYEIPKEAYNLVKEQGIKAPLYAAQGVGQTALNVAKPIVDTASGVGNVILGTLQAGLKKTTGIDLGDKAAEDALNTLGQHLINNKLEDAITVVGKIKKLVEENPEQVLLLADQANAFATKYNKAPTDLVSETAKATKVPQIIEGIKSTPEKTFAKNFNKALPPAKKIDVKIGDKRIKLGQDAFNEIVKAKEEIGLVDKKGLPRNPKTFIESSQAVDTTLKKVYADYTNDLSKVDRVKFDTDLSQSLKQITDDVANKWVKENSIDAQNALEKIQKETANLRDMSPQGMQNYLETINQKIKTAPGAPLDVEQVQYANLAGKIRNALDNAIEKTDGIGYQAKRNAYGALKSIQDSMAKRALAELKNTPSFTEKMGNVGLTVEGLNYLFTHNPQSIAIGLGIKGTAKFLEYMKSPQRSLNKLFKATEAQSPIKEAIPQATIPTANTSSKIIPTIVAPLLPKNKK